MLDSLKFWRRDAAPPPQPSGVIEERDRVFMDAVNQARADGFGNPVTGLGGKNDLACRNTWRHKPPIDRHTAESIYEFSAIGARMVNQEPDDTTREGFELKGIDRQDQENLNQRLGKIEYLPKLADAQRWANLYGGAVIYMQVQDGQKASEPIDMANVLEISGLTVLDRWDINVLNYDQDPNNSNFGKARMYQLSAVGSTSIIHHSRILHFFGAKLPWQAQRRRDGHGASVYDMAWDAFEAYGSSHQLLKNALARIVQGVLKHKGLNAKLLRGDKEEVKTRFKTLLRQSSMLGDMVLDMDNEDYQAINRGVQGFKETLEAFTDHLVANTPLPKSILMGLTPGGLNAGDNGGDWLSWAGYCSAQQKKKLSPPTRRFLDIEFASTLTPLKGPAPDSYEIVWNSIIKMSDLERADIHLKNSQARSADILSLVVTEDQAKRQDDVVEAYKLTEKELAETTPSLIRPEESDLEEAARAIQASPKDRQHLMLASSFRESTKEQRDRALRLVDG